MYTFKDVSFSTNHEGKKVVCVTVECGGGTSGMLKGTLDDHNLYLEVPFGSAASVVKAVREELAKRKRDRSEEFLFLKELQNFRLDP